MSLFLRFMTWVFGPAGLAGAAAEWCETDPKVVVVLCDGEKVPLHVFVTARTEDKHLLHEWKKQEDLWVTTGPGVVVVTGPECEYRTWAEYRSTKPFTIVGDEFAVYPALAVTTITVPAGLEKGKGK
jgi:hypothetical protein